MSNKSCLQTGCLASLLLIALGCWWFYRQLPRLRVESKAATSMTPTQIQSIRDIGQWEFLSVSDEELVDTTRRGIFTDDHLVCIYYGTMRLGVDLSGLSETAFTPERDTLTVVMPPIVLLDEAFIDEARTTVFHESGRWSAEAKEALYDKAHRQMRLHAMTPQNITIARNNADAQLRQMFRAMGFKQIKIRWAEAE